MRSLASLISGLRNEDQSIRYNEDFKTVAEAQKPDKAYIVSDHVAGVHKDVATFNVAHAPDNQGDGFGLEDLLDEKEQGRRTDRTITQVCNMLQTNDISIMGLQETQAFRKPFDKVLANSSPADAKESKKSLSDFKITYGVGKLFEKDQLATVYDGARYDHIAFIDYHNEEKNIRAKYNGQIMELEKKIRNKLFQLQKLKESETEKRSQLTSDEKDAKDQLQKIKADKKNEENETFPDAVAKAKNQSLIQGHIVNLFYDKKKKSYIVHHNLYLSNSCSAKAHNEFITALHEAPLPIQIADKIPLGTEVIIFTGGDLNMRVGHPEDEFKMTNVVDPKYRGEIQGCDCTDAIFKSKRKMNENNKPGHIVIEQLQLTKMNTQGKPLPPFKAPNAKGKQKREIDRQRPCGCISTLDKFKLGKFIEAINEKTMLDITHVTAKINQDKSKLQADSEAKTPSDAPDDKAKSTPNFISELYLGLSSNMHKGSEALCLECVPYDAKTQNDGINMVRFIQYAIETTNKSADNKEERQAEVYVDINTTFVSIPTESKTAVQALEKGVEMYMSAERELLLQKLNDLDAQRIELFNTLLNINNIPLDAKDQAFLTLLKGKQNASYLELNHLLREHIAVHNKSIMNDFWSITREVLTLDKNDTKAMNLELVRHLYILDLQKNQGTSTQMTGKVDPKALYETGIVTTKDSILVTGAVDAMRRATHQQLQQMIERAKPKIEKAKGAKVAGRSASIIQRLKILEGGISLSSTPKQKSEVATSSDKGDHKAEPPRQHNLGK